MSARKHFAKHLVSVIAALIGALSVFVINPRQDDYLAWAVVPKEQPILLKELGAEPVLMFLAPSTTLSVLGLARVLWDDVEGQLGNGCQSLCRIFLAITLRVSLL